MKASLRLLALGLFLLAPFSTAQAQAPMLSPIPNVTVNAGVTTTVNVVAVDVSGRPITLTHALPSFGTLNTPTAANGLVVTSFTLAPTSINVGTFPAAVTATAGGVPSIRVFQIKVNPEGSDQAPAVSAPPLQEVTAGSHLTFTVSVTDPDGDVIESLSHSSLPDASTFTPNSSNSSGVFDWSTGVADAGEYDVMFTATNALSGAAVTHIHVASAPRLAITPIDDVTVEGGSSISVPVNATFMTSAVINLTASLPSFATLNPPGTGTGSVNTTITITPPTGSAGTYHGSVTAISLGMSVTETFEIFVTGDSGPVNGAPVVSAPASRTIAVGSMLGFEVTATDPDGDHVDLFGSSLPPGSNFVDNANNTGSFSWSPVPGQAGGYIASFSGLDNRGGSGSASTAITVTGGGVENRAPTVTAPLTEQVNEGAHLAFTVTASDPDGDHVTLSADSVPSGASFADQGDNTGAFSWTPDAAQSGVYEVAFAGNDARGGTGTASTTVTVMDVGGEVVEVPGKACLLGAFNSRSEITCFRIRPVDGSFDLRDVDLSTITLRFHGQSIPALNGGALLDLACNNPRGGGHHDDGDGDDDGDRRSDNGRGHHGAVYLAGTHHPGDGHGDDGDNDHDGDKDHQDKCGLSCEDDGKKDDCHDHQHRYGYGHGHGHDDCDQDTQDGCDTLGIRACFSTEALRRLFAGSHLPCDLADAEILASLTSGGTVVATFNKAQHEGGHGDEGDDGGGKGCKIKPRVRPNPLNPQAELSFTISREGMVRVAIYDMKGRLVKSLLDGFRGVGDQTLTWDGSNTRSQRVASGVYFLRIQAPEGEVVQRVAVVK